MAAPNLLKIPPIWMRRSADVTDTEYVSFYKSLTNDRENYLAVKHFSVEGQLELHALLFVPRRAPCDLSKTQGKCNDIKLYVSGVRTLDSCSEILPEWLNFVQGVVDYEHVSRNISSHTPQQNKILHMIQKIVVKKCWEMFAEIAESCGLD